MGLKFTDHASWQRWQDSKNRIRLLKARLLGHGDEPLRLRWWRRGSDPKLLVVCDSTSPTNYHSLLAPLRGDALITHPDSISLGLGDDWTPVGAADEHLGRIERLASIGDHLPAGRWAHAEAAARGWRQLVVQHGLLTPFSPPPPSGSEVLAWSDEDAAYLRSGRPDLVTHVVGSALLAAAAEAPISHVSRFESPVFLGQLHGAELSRVGMVRSTTKFWRMTGATYRPHPREEDRASRLQHRLWRRAGMGFDESPIGTRPVVGMYSTGVLEAAIRGVPAWVYYDHPPAWLEEFWERYGLARWGGAPTQPAPIVRSPIELVADHLEGK